MYTCKYKTPIGISDIIMTGTDDCLYGLRFADSKSNAEGTAEKNLPIFDITANWLDIYFTGKAPDFTPLYKIEGISAFEREVIEITEKIPHGEYTTYGEIAKTIAKNRGISKMSAQAVGGALHRNPLCIIIPCHRVIGKNGYLTGYGGGIENKIKLLENEGFKINNLKII